MFGLRWHDLYGMCLRRSCDQELQVLVAAGGAGGAFAWFRAHVYYRLPDSRAFH
jgi:hypothetical protein